MEDHQDLNIPQSLVDISNKLGSIQDGFITDFRRVKDDVTKLTSHVNILKDRLTSVEQAIALFKQATDQKFHELENSENFNEAKNKQILTSVEKDLEIFKQTIRLEMQRALDSLEKSTSISSSSELNEFKQNSAEKNHLLDDRLRAVEDKLTSMISRQGVIATIIATIFSVLGSYIFEMITKK